jgi:hypothetical protein
MTRPTVAAAFPAALLSYAVTRGAERNALLRAAGLTHDDLVDPDARVALDRYLALFDASIAACGDAALAPTVL